MQCPNCGSPMKDTDIKCSYCGYENSERVKQLHKNRMDKIYYKTANLTHLPEMVVKKVFLILKKIFFIVLIGLAAFFIIFSIFSHIQSNTAYDRQQKNLEKLEHYYQQEQYEEMIKYLEKIDDNYRETYRKYHNIGILSERVNWAEDFLDQQDIQSHTKKLFPGSLVLTFQQFGDILHRIDQMEQKGFCYGEKDKAVKIKNYVIHLLTDEVYLTEKEIKEIKENLNNEDKLEAIAEKVCTRIEEEKTS